MGKLRKMWLILAIIILLFIIAGLFIGNYFFNYALSSNTDKSSVVEAEHNQMNNLYEESAEVRQSRIWFDSLSDTERSLTSFDGLNLVGYEIENETPTNRWVIICHGYNSRAKVMTVSAKRFYDMGYNLLMPDARGCGESEGSYIGMGWHDRLDVVAWIDQIVAQDPGAEIVLYGVSMGGATVMMASGEDLPDNVKAIVEDCGYSSVWNEFSYQLKGIFSMPEFPIMHFSSLVTKLRAGFWLGEGSAIKQVAKSKTPIMFIHGDEDTFVPFEMLDKVYDAATCPKEKLVVKGAGHGEASMVAGKLYWNKVDAFLGQYVTPLPAEE